MSSQYFDELLLSLKELYKTSAYSDLTLECGDDEHKVHKVVVCPRSKRLADMLSSHASKEGGQDTLVLAEDDPEAVNLMLYYFYHLDYPDVEGHEAEESNTSQEPQTISSSTPNHVDKSSTGIVNGSHPYGTNGHVQRPMQSSIEKEQSIDPTVVTSPTGTGETSSEAGSKIAKKKKKKSRSVQPESSSETTTTTTPISTTNISNATQTHVQAQEQTSPQPSSSPTNTASVPTLTPTPATTNANTTTQKQKHHHHPPATNLTIHAQLYALASKYNVEGLAALAADKFERGVGRHWGTDDFLRAAREAYTSTDRANRRLRDAVLAAVKTHPELLGRAPVQDAIRGLELSFDLLMHMRGDGNSGGGVKGAGAGAGVGDV